MKKHNLVLCIGLVLTLLSPALLGAAPPPGSAPLVVAPDGASTLGNYVWLDANGDGYHDGPEAEFGAGINGVKVNLYQDLNKNGVIDAAEYVGSAITGDDPNAAGTQTGFYSFGSITANGAQYIVEIDPSNYVVGGPLDGYILTSKATYGLGGDPTVVLLPQLVVNYVDADFGFMKAPLSVKKVLLNSSVYAVIGDTVTFRITVTNSGTRTLDPVPLDDFYSPACLKYMSATVTPSLVDTAGGALHWNNIGPLGPGASKNIDVTFTVQSSEEMAWKEGGWKDYAPNGVPDFDARQPGWDWPLGSGTGWYQTAAVAAANSVWWRDSKFELGSVDGSILPPPNVADTYPLVPSFSPAVAWDDHDARNVQPLVSQLSSLMGTAPATGTTVTGLADGLTQYIADRGLASAYTVLTQQKPTFAWLGDAVRRSEDAVLLLGFWQAGLNDAPAVRLGGLYVTASGVDLLNNRIAVSDPIRNQAEETGSGRVLPGSHVSSHPTIGPAGDRVHNDARYISQDVYASTAIAASISAGSWGPAAYVNASPATGCDQVATFQGKNVPGEFNAQQGQCNKQGGQISTVVEYAVVVSPKANTLMCSPTTNIVTVTGAIVADTGVVLPPAQADAHVTEGMDLGDLPSSYPTLRVNDGARHLITSPLVLGTKIDAETDGQPTATATGDDVNGLVPDDEDGVVYQSGLGGSWTDGSVASKRGGSLQIVISGGRGIPQLFIDFLGQGLQGVILRDATGAVLPTTPWMPGTYRVYFDVPSGFMGVARAVATRVRLSSAGGLVASGVAVDGEVEDYIFSFGPTSVSVTSLAAVRAAQPAAFGAWLALVLLGLAAVGLMVSRFHARRVSRR